MPSAPSPRGCICYVVDEGHLLPTLVSAGQARRQVSPGLADVLIVCVGAATARIAAAAAAAARLGIIFLQVSKGDIGHLHVSFGRFFLSELLPACYGRIVYIDGDTQVRRTLDPLLQVDIPPGGFLACRDPGVLFARRDPALRRRMLAHRVRIGLAAPPENYCNSGVLVFEREAWREVARASVAVYRERGAAFVHPDQDALNLAAAPRCTLISNRWNFPGFLIGSSAEAETRPHIYHFMSDPRPWRIAAQPLGEAWQAPYRELLTQFPELELLRPRPSRAYAALCHLRQLIGVLLACRAIGRMREAPAELTV